MCADELLAAQREWEFNDTDYTDRNVNTYPCCEWDSNYDTTEKGRTVL